MGKKKQSAPKPPVISIPEPSADEKELMKKQIAMIDQLTKQGDITFQQGQDDRLKSFDFLDQLSDGNFSLNDFETQLVDNLAQSYYDQAFSNLTTGSQREIFDQQKRDAILNLASSGMTNSTTGAEILAALEKDKLRAIEGIAGQAGQNKLLMTKDFLDKKLATTMDLFQGLYSGGQSGTNLGNQLINSALAGSGQAQQKLSNDRLNAFNVGVQNAQAQYAWQMQNYQNQKRGGLGGLLGGGLGALGGLALAGITGGAALPFAMGGFGLGSKVGAMF